jgi:hypothetical protein
MTITKVHDVLKEGRETKKTPTPTQQNQAKYEKWNNSTRLRELTN